MVASFPMCKRLRIKNAKCSKLKRRYSKQKDQIGDFLLTDQ
jgi:hypothetical protein